MENADKSCPLAPDESVLIREWKVCREGVAKITLKNCHGGKHLRVVRGSCQSCQVNP